MCIGLAHNSIITNLYDCLCVVVRVEARPAVSSYDLAPGANKEKYVLKY